MERKIGTVAIYAQTSDRDEWLLRYFACRPCALPGGGAKTRRCAGGGTERRQFGLSAQRRRQARQSRTGSGGGVGRARVGRLRDDFSRIAGPKFPAGGPAGGLCQGW